MTALEIAQELKDDLDFVNTGLFVSITPDGILDLNPSDAEIMEAIAWAFGNLRWGLGEGVPEPKDDLLWNVLVHCWHELEIATQSTSTHALRVVRQLGNWLDSILPEQA